MHTFKITRGTGWFEKMFLFAFVIDRGVAGGLTIGFTGYGSMDSRHHIGPELQIGHQLGDAFEAPVLLVKTAWGGRVFL